MEDLENQVELESILDCFKKASTEEESNPIESNQQNEAFSPPLLEEETGGGEPASKLVRKFHFIEVFDTWQGEGPDTGKACVLVRFKECNRCKGIDIFGCAGPVKPCPWCDTMVKMRVYEESEYTIEQINRKTGENKLLLITGGEPGFYMKETLSLILLCKATSINVETNGMNLQIMLQTLTLEKKPRKKRVAFMYSPKIFSDSDLSYNLHMVNLIASYFDPEYNKKVGNRSVEIYLKLVYGPKEKEDPRIEIYLKEITKIIPSNKIWIMPEGGTTKDLLSNFPVAVDKAEELNCNISPRLHLMYNFV